MANNLQEAAQQGQSVVFKNTIQKSNTIKVTFTAAANAAATSDVYLFVGAGNNAAKSLPANVTISGDYSNAADFYEMMQSVRFGVSEIKVETNQTNNYEGTKITFGKRNLNNRNNQEQDLFLSDFQVATGNGIKKTATIDVDSLNGGFMVEPQFYAVFKSLLQNTAVTFYIKVSHEEMTGALQPANF